MKLRRTPGQREPVDEARGKLGARLARAASGEAAEIDALGEDRGVVMDVAASQDLPSQ
jgi:hypothetical protein